MKKKRRVKSQDNFFLYYIRGTEIKNLEHGGNIGNRKQEGRSVYEGYYDARIKLKCELPVHLN